LPNILPPPEIGKVEKLNEPRPLLAIHGKSTIIGQGTHAKAQSRKEDGGFS
jgi:hypothetical protein